MKRRINRRDFLKQSAFVAAALSVPPLAAPAAIQAKLERKGAAKKVIIIGAGLAGLSAAYELTQAGHDVTVLEAQMRPGGRVLTMREPFSDGLYAEAGAMMIPDTHDFTLRYVQLFGLDLDRFGPPPELRAVVYERGKRLVIAQGSEPEHPYDLSPEEKKMGLPGIWEKYDSDPVFEKLGNPAASDWPLNSLKKYDHMTYREFLRSQGWSSEAIALMTVAFLWGDGAETVSALVVLRDYVHYMKAQNWSRIRGGNDLLPKAFAARLKEKIRYGSPAVRVEHGSDGIRVVFLQARTHQTIAGDYLICAVPFSVLRHIEVSPRFLPEKQRAIEQLPYFSAARVSLQSRTRFWVDQELTGFAETDLPIADVYHMTSNQLGFRGILQCYAGGPEARRITAMKESERISFVLEQMEKVYPGIRENFEGGASKCWDEDPWERGASSWYKPGQMTELWPHVARPEGRVHFAGDHTSAWIRWMQGALHSGNRTAREVNDAA